MKKLKERGRETKGIVDNEREKETKSSSKSVTSTSRSTTSLENDSTSFHIHRGPVDVGKRYKKRSTRRPLTASKQSTKIKSRISDKSSSSSLRKLRRYCKSKKALLIVPLLSSLFLITELRDLSSRGYYNNNVHVDVPSEEEATYLSLCRELIKRDVSDQNSRILIVGDDYTCRDETDWWMAMVQIFSAGLVAFAGEELNVFYEHGCSKTAIPGTLQHQLPSNLNFTHVQGRMKLKHVQQACQKCVEKKFLASKDCLLQESQDVTEFILHSMSSTLSDVITPSSLQISDPESAMIYLDCAQNTPNTPCEVVAVPMFIFAAEIPNGVSNIDIIASAKCGETSSLCIVFGESVRTFLMDFYPRATISFSVQPHHLNVQSLQSMTSANYLICPPSTSCLLSALLTHNKASIAQSHLYPWLPTSNIHLLPNPSLRVLSRDIPLHNSPSGLTDFLQLSPMSKEYCTSLRGRTGTWNQDYSYAKAAQYHLPLQVYAGTADINFQPTKDNPYRKPTTWKWLDSHYKETCPTYLFDNHQFCDLLQRNNIKRVFLLGDSLTFQMSQSLWKLLGYLHEFAEDKAPFAEQYIQCSNLPFSHNKKSNHEFLISFVRNDRLADVTEGPHNLTHKNCQYGYCYPWTDKYLSYAHKTLFIANTGAHSHEKEIFHYDFDAFISLIDSFPVNKNNDIFYFRSSSPGHINCQLPNLEPFADYHAYAKTITTKFAWNKFQYYNDYATSKLHKHARIDYTSKIASITNSSSSTTASSSFIKQQLQYYYHHQEHSKRIYALDIFPMTVLRQDGHVGGADCVNCGFESDCLHYSLPGPVDWWNHLLFSDLLDRFS